MKVPTIISEKGFYYHYKHDPTLSINNYTYELIGVGLHSEADENFAIYLPIYESRSYKAGKFLVARPLDMFMENIEKDGKTMKRFTKITDEAVIAKLKEIKTKLY
jgi:hypothetical protein